MEDLISDYIENIKDALEEIALNIVEEIRSKHSNKTALDYVIDETDNYLEHRTNAKQILADLWLYDTLLKYVEKCLQNKIIEEELL